MRKSILLLCCLIGYCCAGPVGQKKNMPIMQRDDEPMIMEPTSAEVEAEADKPAAPAQEMMMMSTLTLPSNATSIRADITDNFSCENKTYGYYADVENECQIFHVCLPVTYADGKENTFRWSFICPEETVFSQESFTCMRREDMSIDCEESYKYYELNRNFGVIEEESNKNTNTNSNSNTNTIANEDQQTAMSMQSEQQQQYPLQPTEEENVEMPVSAPVPAQVQPQPVRQKEKPVQKVQKPNRRKPIQTFTTHKKPANYPLRKTAQVAPAVLEATTLQPVVDMVQIEEVKPTAQRFTKRPSTMSTAIKERIQPGKAEATPIRVELYNQKRKRPAYFNKKDAISVKPAAEATAVEVAQPALTEPAPTLKIESMFNTAVQPAQDASQATPIDEKVETELPKSDSPVSQTDTETQASEIAEVILKPAEIVEAVAEELPKVEQAQPIEHTVVIEKIAEPLQSEPEMASMPALEEALKSDETQLPIEAIEEIPAVIVEMEDQPEASNEKETQMPIEALEEIPAVIVEMQEHPEASNEKESVDEEAINTAKDSYAVQTEEVHITADKPNEGTEDLLTAPEVSVAEPAIFEENSEEGIVASPSLAEMEAEKPADAVETMAATPEMEQQDPMVQQMFEETDAHKQSMGGFRPVDPVMAAEAEALITDFLNTLRNAEAGNSKPAQQIEVAEEKHEDASENQETMLKPEENEKTESQEIDTIIPAAVTAEASDIPAMTEIQISPLEESKQEDVSEPEMLKNAAPISNMMQMHNFPAEMYQIPVQVIETPVEEVQNEEIPVENTEILDDQPQAPEGTHMATDYMPLSIDDIVELVKERLDQVPAAEKGTPIEMVMEQASDEKSLEEKTTEEKQVEEEEHTDAKPTEQQSEEKLVEQPAEEEIVMPIYHRLSEVDSNMPKTENVMANEVSSSSDMTEDKPEETIASLKSDTEDKLVQTDDIVQAAANTETEAQVPSYTEDADADAKAKASRSYRSRSMKNAKMDPRKRRFLFRSDSS